MADYSVEVDHAGAIGVTSTLLGLDHMDTTVHVPETVKGDTTVHVPETVKGDATVHVPEPVQFDSSLDVKPVAVDQCLRIELAPLPPTVLRSPWEQRVAVSLLGIELFALTLSGEARTYVEPARREPLLVDADRMTRQEHGPVHTLDAGGLQIRLGAP